MPVCIFDSLEMIWVDSLSVYLSARVLTIINSAILTSQ